MNKRSFLKLFGLGAASVGASLIPSASAPPTEQAQPPKQVEPELTVGVLGKLWFTLDGGATWEHYESPNINSIDKEHAHMLTREALARSLEQLRFDKQDY